MIRWMHDHLLGIGDTTFDIPGAGDNQTADFTVVKTKTMVEFYEGIADELRGGSVFEAGIFKGGSTAMFAALFEPSSLVAIDLGESQNPGLDPWIEANGFADTVVLRYGVDQTDRKAIESILDDVIGDEPLDLIIDDASHLLGPTTDTFNLLFPRLREGGLYVIEDWSASLQMWKVLKRPDASEEERGRAERSFLRSVGDIGGRQLNSIIVDLIRNEPLVVVDTIKRFPELTEKLPPECRHMTIEELETRAREHGFDDVWTELAEEHSSPVTEPDRADSRELLPLVTDLTRVLGMHDDEIVPAAVEVEGWWSPSRRCR